MQKLLPSLLLIFCSLFTKAQNVGVGTNTPHASAALEIQDTSRGILISRMTMVQRNAIQNPAEGLMVYQTDSTRGFWYFSSNLWRYFLNNSAIINNNATTTLNYVFPDTALYYWGHAISSCSVFSHNGFSDWRIPTQEEMTRLIMQYGTSVFPSGISSYWTSTSINYVQYNQLYNYNTYVLVNANDRSGNPGGVIFRCSYSDYTISSGPVDKHRIVYIR